ncbi:ribonuclease HepT family protein [Zoogloea dura]|jgi:uncharacterized protein with HEPN domain|uniref:DUF86 domain-containing protein n=1 Tax=Zoogloea dura TaxID=2728840 RepID=A0A848G3X6_9RHOO|nr:hypothetical protein [Zoogloea dura]NML24381.1 hypothetical protein [Zoogloea dura]
MSETLRTHPQQALPSPAPLCNRVLREVLLGNLQDAAEAIERCTDGRDMRSVFAFPALRNELLEGLTLMGESARALAAEDKACMPAVDWPAWDALSLLPAGPIREWRERLWDTIQVLVPQTRREVSRYLGRLTDTGTAARH